MAKGIATAYKALQELLENPYYKSLQELANFVQAVDSYVSLVDPSAGCSLEAEPFVLAKPARNAEQPTSDKNRRLRPGGTKSGASDQKNQLGPAGVNGGASEYAVGKNIDLADAKYYPRKLGEPIDLVRVQSERTVREELGGVEPVALLSLAAWQANDSVTCIPFLRELQGFDTRIGNQVTFQVQSVPQGENATAAILVTRILYNPFAYMSGHLTILHYVSLAEPSMAGRLFVDCLDVRVAPQEALYPTRDGILVTVQHDLPQSLKDVPRKQRELKWLRRH